MTKPGRLTVAAYLEEQEEQQEREAMVAFAKLMLEITENHRQIALRYQRRRRPSIFERLGRFFVG